MNVSFTSEQESRLSDLAEHRGISVEKMLQDAAARMLDEDRRFREAVQVGIDAADRGDFVDSAEVWAGVEALLRS